MIGRASIGYPWIFDEIKHFMQTGEKLAPPTIQQRAHAARRHLEMALEWKGERQGVLETRRHYANYFKGFPNFKEYRMRLVTLENSADIFNVLDEIVRVYAEKVIA